ncbi:MAG: hypothetical protein ACYCYO_15055 [Bacilli bacterium]
MTMIVKVIVLLVIILFFVRFAWYLFLRPLFLLVFGIVKGVFFIVAFPFIIASRRKRNAAARAAAARPPSGPPGA